MISIPATLTREEFDVIRLVIRLFLHQREAGEDQFTMRDAWEVVTKLIKWEAQPTKKGD